MAFTYVTPKEYVELAGEDCPYSLEQLEAQSREDKACSNCGAPAWKLAGLGMCFSCTTGEADNSNDYELTPEAS